MAGLCLEDLTLGRAARRTHTVTEEAIQAFAALTGDDNPVHMDEDYAAGTRFKGRIAHGMLTAGYISAVLGVDLPGPGAIYLSQSLRFRRPVRIGDEVEASVVVQAIDPATAQVTLRTTCSVGGKPVIEGEAVVMVARRSV